EHGVAVALINVRQVRLQQSSQHINRRSHRYALSSAPIVEVKTLASLGALCWQASRCSRPCLAAWLAR
ncbi:MAG TPA: hypothetical protein PLF81_29990, partial [Candidatus Anammoximicrobium sp.]|nr:hypothetical protein [Candidatus Anammoximicrobium sp.]